MVRKGVRSVKRKVRRVKENMKTMRDGRLGRFNFFVPEFNGD